MMLVMDVSGLYAAKILSMVTATVNLDQTNDTVSSHTTLAESLFEFFSAMLTCCELGHGNINNASLSPPLRLLFDLWTEWTVRSGGQKLAKDFTAAERGAGKFKYSCHKVAWELIAWMDATELHKH
jgi:hypothetical protein